MQMLNSVIGKIFEPNPKVYSSTGPNISVEYIYIILRFANIFRLTPQSVDKIWKVVKRVKRKTSLDKHCGSNPILFQEHSDWASRVTAVEQELQIVSTEETSQNIITVLYYFIFC